VNYISTRGGGSPVDFETALLTGLAGDGGLYVPESWPQFSTAELTRLARLDYAELAFEVMAPLVGDAIPSARLQSLIDAAYDSFDHKAVTPLVQLDRRNWLLELFHGPTLAFKDVALQLVGRLFDDVLTRRKARVTILVATSGDTGSAAIHAIAGRAAADIFVLHPHGRTSDIQRLQMTTVTEPNVHNIAIEGTFDDCQALVKAMFNDSDFRDKARLSGMNSINWARVMPQIVDKETLETGTGTDWREVAFERLADATSIGEGFAYRNDQQITDALLSGTPVVVGISVVWTKRMKARMNAKAYAQIGGLTGNAIQRKKAMTAGKAPMSKKEKREAKKAGGL
jgi:threonine synthase